MKYLIVYDSYGQHAFSEVHWIIKTTGQLLIQDADENTIAVFNHWNRFEIK